MPVWAIVIIVVLMIAVLVNEWRTRKKPIRRTESGGSTEGSSWKVAATVSATPAPSAASTTLRTHTAGTPEGAGHRVVVGQIAAGGSVWLRCSVVVWVPSE